jgi:hypothetical protein
VLEDDALFLPDSASVLRQALRELAQRHWSLLCLGAPDSKPGSPRAEGSHNLQAVPAGNGLTTLAIAYHRSAFTHLLDELSDTVEGMSAWIQQHTALDQYLARWDRLDCYRTVPAIATRTNQIDLVAEDLRDQYVS